jgi:hypothetical protein
MSFSMTLKPISKGYQLSNDRSLRISDHRRDAGTASNACHKRPTLSRRFQPSEATVGHIGGRMILPLHGELPKIVSRKRNAIVELRESESFIVISPSL